MVCLVVFGYPGSFCVACGAHAWILVLVYRLLLAHQFRVLDQRLQLLVGLYQLLARPARSSNYLYSNRKFLWFQKEF